MAAAIHTQTVEATVTVRVSQAAAGDLAAGARAQLERVEGVDVEALSIAGLQPGLNDTTVEAVATLSVPEADRPVERAADRAADRLADGFGVEPERVERVDPPG
ncbi:hypothetical protein C471_01704 [Halorubrum saccharovorum DSM 1137]|uniref:Uncharacterized protein n=1 Tax=Halorubrum saccharovorum DSM 1137 TaxID=1227484 RepID=M0E881_9EURY|nr:hypothetical protein [Halorubrum saccharovorum]ELZ43132.1 hypothetical protein C471_01704 [Halorubrum saccharovorum DSM 1137]